MSDPHIRHLGRPLRPEGECPDCDHQCAQLNRPFSQPSASRCPECGGTEGHYVDCSRLSM